MPIDPTLTYEELKQLQNEIAAEIRNIEQQREANEKALRDAVAVDAEIMDVTAHAAKIQKVIDTPDGQDLATVETGVHLLAEALYSVGVLSVRAARLAANRTDSTTLV